MVAGAGAELVAPLPPDAAICWAKDGIPFMRYSTATSGFPWEARRQARTSASGNPIAVKLLMVSAGNSSAAGAAAGDVVAAVVLEAVTGAGVSALVAASVAAGRSGAAGVLGSEAGAGVAGVGAGAAAATFLAWREDI